MRVELAELHQRLGVTMIYVTHDQVEAMTLADQIVVMNAGRIEQVGTPLELYERPQTEFVAAFIGSPKMNLIRGEAAQRFGAAAIGIRPEHIAFDPEGIWQGKVRLVERLGNESIAYVDTEAGEITLRITGNAGISGGDNVRLTPQREYVHCFDDTGRRVA